MPETTERGERRLAERRRAEFLTVGVGVGLTHLFTAWGLLPMAESILVAWSVALAVGYWLPPRPRESYVRWVLEALILVVAFYLAFFKAPALLKPMMPSLIAYGLPALLFFGLYTWWLISARRGATKGEPNKSFEMTPR